MVDEIITLREFFDAKILALEKATSLAAANMEKRLESMNEFRAQLKDQTSTFVTIAEYTSTIAKAEKDISDLQISRATLAGKASQGQLLVSYIISAISLIIGITGVVIALSNQP